MMCHNLNKYKLMFAQQTDNSLSSCLLALRKSFAFTLAEVLITLAIIGVVAAITMPTLIQNYKKHVTVNRLKSAYSILSQAINRSQSENGELANWDYNLTDIDFAKKYVLPYLKVIDTKDKSFTGWVIYTLSTQRNVYSGFINWAPSIVTNPIYILSNGYAICIADKYITIDINVRKGPNVMGIDGFTFEFNKQNNQLVPAGYSLTRDILLGKNGATNPTGLCVRDNSWQYYRGRFCAAVIMKDGWKISPDYPWGNGGKTPLPKD